MRGEILDYQHHTDILELGVETQNFCRIIRFKVQDWITAKMFGEEQSKLLTLTSSYGGHFSALQKPLISQIIETHFFEYRVCSKHDSEHGSLPQQSEGGEVEWTHPSPALPSPYEAN